MTRGFVTIATGKENYYKTAQTLMLSYKQTSENPLPFALICDAENKYTAEFDDVVILPNATRSYLDKMELLKVCPYDETIFIDSDCIAFGDLNHYWSYFENATDFSCFGAVLSMDAKNGWFWKDSIGDYAEKISFIPRFHGGIYFVRKGEVCNKIYDTCMDVRANWSKYRFASFNRPADEPIIALAMTVQNCRPVQQGGECYAFLPRRKVSANYYKKKCVSKRDGKRQNILLVHYTSRGTVLPFYTITSKMVHFFHKNKRQWNVVEGLYHKTACYLRFWFFDFFNSRYPQRLIAKIKKFFKSR